MLTRVSGLALGALLVASGAFADTSNISVTVFIAQCTDSADNDGDSLIDYPSDPGCDSPGDDDEADPVAAACEDGIDNDADGYTDYPADPGCDSISDDSEVDLSSGGGGGGGGRGTVGYFITPDMPTGAVTLAGYAGPAVLVRVFLDNRFVAETAAGRDGVFMATLTGIQTGLRTVGLIGLDSSGRTTSLLNVPIRIARDSRTSVTGVLLSPTLNTSRGSVSGIAVPRATVRVIGSAAPPVVSGDDGTFSVRTGPGSFQAIVSMGNMTSGASLPVTVDRETVTEERARTGDLNNDDSVDLTDFSILMHWFRKPLTPGMIDLERRVLSGDGRIDFTDFSIMAYHWTN